jgi:hypothetical protein
MIKKKTKNKNETITEPNNDNTFDHNKQNNKQ